MVKNIKILLDKYSAALLNQTNEVLIPIYDVEIDDNITHIKFKIRVKNIKTSFEMFDIYLLNLDVDIKIIVTYFNVVETHYVKIEELESKMDELIQSEKLSSYITYLLGLYKNTNNTCILI